MTEVLFASCTFPGRGHAGPSGFFLAAQKVSTQDCASGPSMQHIVCIWHLMLAQLQCWMLTPLSNTDVLLLTTISRLLCRETTCRR